MDRRKTALAVFGGVALSSILVPFVHNRANSDFDKAPVTVVSLIVLALVCVAEYAIYWVISGRLQAQIVELKRQISAADPAEVLRLSLNHPNRPADRNIRYTQITLSVDINGFGDYAANYEIQGMNVSQSLEAVNQIRVLTCADSNLDFEQLGVTAVDVNRNNAILKLQAIEDNPRQKLFDIILKESVLHSDQFHIRWSILWRGLMRRARDYDYITLIDYKQGVDRLSYTLKFEKELATGRFEEIQQDGKVSRVIQPAVKALPNGYTYTLDLPQPKGAAYRFCYENY